MSDEVKEPPKKNMKLFSFMQTPASSTSQNEEEDLSIKMRQELVDYVKLPLLDYDSDPLAWWKVNEKDFIHVARAARSVLSIPVSSAPVERIFSTEGKMFRPERTRLTAEKFESMMFITCNKHL